MCNMCINIINNINDNIINININVLIILLMCNVCMKY